jgi:hypothetical protein
MKRELRKAVSAIPFGCLTAIAVHAVRFGDEHAFGGEANPLLVATAAGGSLLIALAILHAFLTGGTTTPTGTLAAARLRERMPGAGSIFICAAGLYYGIEALEGHGFELGLPTLLLGIAAAAVAAGFRAFVAWLAGMVADLIRQLFALLSRRERAIHYRMLPTRPIHSQVAVATRQFGRAPPFQRRRR